MDFLSHRTTVTENPPSTISSPQTNPGNPAPMFGRFMNWCLYALVLLIPLIFLPITSEFREFNKQTLLVFGVLLMVGVWMIKVLVSRKLGWQKSVLGWAALGYLLVYLVSSILSVDKVSSFLGYMNRYSGSFLAVFASVLLYFLLINNVRHADTMKKIVNTLLAASGLVLVYSLLQIFGVYVLPQFTHSSVFNPIGSLLGLGIFADVSILFYQWMNLSEPAAPVWKKTLLGILTLLGLVVLFMISSTYAWIILLVGSIVFLVVGMHFARSESHTWFWQPMLVLVLSVLFVAFVILPNAVNPRNLVKSSLPQEIQLSTKVDFAMVKNSYRDAKQALVGSGPGTIGVAFGQIKPEALNKTIVWNLNFDRASSEIGNVAIETGILGLIAFEALALIFLVYSLRYLFKQTDAPGRMYAFGFFTVWAVLYISHFVAFFNTTAMFLFWLSMGGFVAATKLGQEPESMTPQPVSSKSTLLWMTSSLLVLAAILVGLFFEATVYVADAAYASGIKTLNQKNPDFARAEVDFSRAGNLNPYRDVYMLAYSQNEIFLASIEAAKKSPNVQLVGREIQAAVAAAKNATAVSPSKASNWSALAQTYTSVKPFGVGGTEQQAVNAWLQAINHDPKNPVLYAQLAQAYVNAASMIDTAAISSGTDSDHDGLSDAVEQKIGSDPNKADTNGNGISDGDEVRAGLNPAGNGSLTSVQASVVMKTDPVMFKKAEDALNQAISLKKDLPDPYIALARVYEQENKISDSNKILDEAAAEFPYNADVKYEQGRVTFNEGKLDEAAVIFNDVLKLQPNHANALYSLALIDLQHGNKDAALTKLQKVRDISGPNVDLDKLIDSIKNPSK